MIKVIKDKKDKKGGEFQLKLDKRFIWVIPYLECARKLGIPTWRLKEIRGYYVSKDKVQRQLAACHIKGRKYKIVLLALHQVYSVAKNGKFQVSGWESAQADYNFEDTLDTLAHELSHMVVWDHNADRYILEKKLQVIFAKLAKKLGYKGYNE